MILSVHMLAGAAIGSKAKKYWAIFILAIISHFVLDAIPHWEYATQFIDAANYDFMVITLKASIDLIAGAATIYFILRSSNLLRPASTSLGGPALLGAFFGLLPDGFNFLYFLFKITLGWNITPLYYFMTLHNKIHFTDGNNLLLWRAVAEVVVAIIAIFILWQARRTTKQPN